MNNFNLDNSCGSVRVQYWRYIFNNVSYYTIMAIALNTTGTLAKVSMQKGINLISFACDSLNVIVPAEFAIDTT